MNKRDDLNDRILNCKDSNDLLADSIAKAYINANPYDRQTPFDDICKHIVAEHFARAGWLLSNMIYANVREQADKDKRDERDKKHEH